MAEINGQRKQEQADPLLAGVTIAPRRPLDDLGPPSDPLLFPPPRVVRGRRDDVTVYNPRTGDLEVVTGVLVRADSATTQKLPSAMRLAYFTDPHRHPIETITGHVEFCDVLEEAQGDFDYNGAEGDIVYRRTDRRVAVKVHYTDNKERLRGRRKENPMHEIAALQMLGAGPVHVLGAQEVLLDGGNIHVVMHCCDGGDFFDMIESVRDRNDHPAGTPGMTEGEARFWFRQIIEGAAFLHSKGICHHDLSPENVMIDGRESFVIDLGMSLRIPYQDPQNNERVTNVQNSQGRTPRCLIRPQGAYGKLPYMSPEIYRNKRPFDGAAVDIWSAGVILFRMITGNSSYQYPHKSDSQFFWMTRLLPRLLDDWNVNMTEAGIQLLEGMLQADPRLRLTLEEVRQHAWFDGPYEPPEHPM